MSTKRKKNSTNPAGREIKFIKIHDEGPWEDDYYMCGMCGHAISYATVVRHARDAHGGSRATLLALEPTEEGQRLPPDNTSGKSVKMWCDDCTHHMSFHRLENPHACVVDECVCGKYANQVEMDELIAESFPGLPQAIKEAASTPGLLAGPDA